MEVDGGFCSPQQGCNVFGDKVVDPSVEVLGKLGGIFLSFLGTTVVTLDLVVPGLNRSSQRILKPEKQSSTWSVCS